MGKDIAAQRFGVISASPESSEHAEVECDRRSHDHKSKIQDPPPLAAGCCRRENAYKDQLANLGPGRQCRRMAKLEIRFPDGLVEIKELKRDRSFLIGSDAACDLRLEGELIQPRHCTIRWVDRRYRLEADPNAKNVFVGVNPIQQLRLKPDAEFSIGEIDLRLRYDPSEVGTVLMPADEPSMATDLAARIPLYRSGTFLAIVSALAVLAIAGVGLYFLVQARDAKQRIDAARRDLSERLYSKAIPALESFLEKYPNNDQAGEARYMLAKARVEQFTDSSAASWTNAFETAEGLIDGLANDGAFANHRTEIGDILLSISHGLAAQSRDRSDADALRLSEEMLEKAGQSLGKSILESERAVRVRGLQEEARLAVAKSGYFEESISRMKTSLDGDKPADVYNEYVALLHRYADAKDDSRIQGLLRQAAQKEQSLVTFEPKGVLHAVDPAEPPPAWTRYVHAARGQPPPGPILPVLVADTLFGLDSGTGQVRWRTPIGYATAFSPVSSAKPADWILAYRAMFNDLVLLDPATGKMTARAALRGVRPRSRCPAVVSGDHVFITATDDQEGAAGIVLTLRIAPGEINEVGRYLFPQPIVTPVAVDGRGGTLYVVGEQASLYQINTDSRACERVVSLGHEAGAIRLPPLLIDRILLVVESTGIEQSRLRCLIVGDATAQASEKPSLALRGRVEEPPLFRNQRVFVTTTAGQSVVAELGLETDATPLVQSAELIDPPSQDERPATLIARSDTEVWVLRDSARRCQVNLERGEWTSDKEIPLAGRSSPASRLVGDRVVAIADGAENGGLIVQIIDPAAGTVVATSRLGELPADVALAGQQGLTLLYPQGIAAVEETTLSTDEIVPVPPLPPQAALYTSPVRICLADSDGVLAWNESGFFLVRKSTSRPGVAAATSPVDGGIGGKPTAYRDGILVPSKTGFVFDFDRNGVERPDVDPFAATLEGGKLREFTAVALADPNAPAELAFAVGGGELFRIQRASEPHLQWKESSRVDVGLKVVDHLLVEAERVWCFGSHKVAVVNAETMVVEAAIELALAEDAAPIAADSSILAINNKRELVRLGLGRDGKAAVLWSSPAAGTPAGSPACREGLVWVADVNGDASAFSLESGQLSEKRPLGRAVARGPWLVGDDVVVLAADGSLCRIPPPR